MSKKKQGTPKKKKPTALEIAKVIVEAIAAIAALISAIKWW